MTDRGFHLWNHYVPMIVDGVVMLLWKLGVEHCYCCRYRYLSSSHRRRHHLLISDSVSYLHFECLAIWIERSFVVLVVLVVVIVVIVVIVLVVVLQIARVGVASFPSRDHRHSD